jgi:hypothetical protein
MNLIESEIKLQHLLKDIPEPQTSRRMDCPSCGGKNTFSVTNLGTVILFYCFKASCKLKGRRQTDISTESLKREFEVVVNKKSNSSFSLDRFIFIPETVGRERINKFLHDNNCWDAYREDLADIRYDPYDDRIVFMIWDLSTGVPIDAVGKRLTKGGAPKWRRYGKSSQAFICPTNRHKQDPIYKTLIIVEDCCSACAASAYCDSAALLGTFLQANYLKEFLQYERFIIALDKDASKLALSMQKELQYYRPTTIHLLTEDLKCYNSEEIRRLFDV